MRPLPRPGLHPADPDLLEPDSYRSVCFAVAIEVGSCIHFAHVADAIVILIRLIRVWNCRAIIDAICNMVAISVISGISGISILSTVDRKLSVSVPSTVATAA